MLSSFILDENGDFSNGNAFRKEVIDEQQAAKADLKRANEDSKKELIMKKQKLNEQPSIFDRSKKASTGEKVTEQVSLKDLSSNEKLVETPKTKTNSPNLNCSGFLNLCSSVSG